MSLSEKLKKCRNTKGCRLGIIGLLIAIVVLLLIFWGKAKIALWIILIVLLGAFGVEYFNYDIDLGRLWDTGSVQESRVEHRNGMKVFGQECAGDNLNCIDFKTQAEAQAKYEACSEQIATDNQTTEEAVKNIDVYGLDGDKDGTVCEALPRGA